MFKHFLALFIALFVGFHACTDALTLGENLQRSRVGDYIVTIQNKNYSLLHIFDKQNDSLTIEEICVPANRINQGKVNWRDWYRQGAPYHTAWVIYKIQLSTGKIFETYSVPQQTWVKGPPEGQFLPTLLNLYLTRIPDKERKRIGSAECAGFPDTRPLWRPKMISEGKEIPNVAFWALRAHWPKDNSQLSGRWIDIYLPEESDKYPSYFPYWLEFKGMSGSRVTVHIVDSGSNLFPAQTQEDSRL